MLLTMNISNLLATWSSSVLGQSGDKSGGWKKFGPTDVTLFFLNFLGNVRISFLAVDFFSEIFFKIQNG